jgi:hypothetical protein
MTRKEDIAALLAKAAQQLREILKEYEASLQERQIVAPLRVDIKNYYENLRSVLDYLACGIREKNCPSADPKAKFYFPIFPNAAEFKSKTTKWFPGLRETAPMAWQELEKCQPYQPGYEWLGKFNKVNNTNKHGSLVPQTCEEVGSRVEAHMADGGCVSWDPASVTFGSGVFIGGVPINPLTQMPSPDPKLRVSRTTWVDFQFDGIDGSAIQLLKDAFHGVKDIGMSLAPFS